MNQHRHPPNRLLAWERLQRGWSYAEITERVRAEMAHCGETDTGLTANTVRRWETGERWPDPATASTSSRSLASRRASHGSPGLLRPGPGRGR